MSTIVYTTSTRVPDPQEVSVYRGDFMSFSIVQTNVDGEPFDFSIYDSFKTQIRIGDSRNPNIHVTISDQNNFLLGKSDSAYTVYDELHVLSGNALDFDDFYPIAWMDIEGTIGTEIYTLAKFKLLIKPDVTR